MARNAPLLRIALSAAITSIALVAAPSAGAANGGGASCTQYMPTVIVENEYQRGSPGSFGLPGQQLTYAIRLVNNDVGCSSSSFSLSLAAPNGFTVSIPTSTVSLGASSSAHLFAYVTSPAVAADGDYPLTATATRASGQSGASISYYKVYSSDAAAPWFDWSNPWDGANVSGRSYNVTVSSYDDHAVKTLDLYIDNVYKSSTSCQDIVANCQIYYTWSLRRVSPGQHTVTFKASDWMGNVAVKTVTFTVS